MQKPTLIILMGLISCPIVLAWKLTAPYPDFKEEGDYLILNSTSPDQSSRVIFHNKSEANLMIDRVLVDNPGVSAGWSSQLDSKHWSVLNWQGSRFTISCKQSIEGQWQPVACAKVLKLYQLKKASHSPSNQGSYWVLENQTRSQLFRNLSSN